MTAPQSALGSGVSVRPSAAAQRPAQSSGRVMSSGNRVVSQSMHAKASKAAENPHQTKAVHVRPHFQPHQAKTAAFKSSTAGYLGLILA